MTNMFGLVAASDSFPAAKVAMVVAGCLALFVAFKVGRFILKVLLGLAALALLAGALWWFLLKQ
jgi:hypothetical protein